MTATQLSTVLSLFYVGYLIFELPACLFLKKVTANLQLGAALIFWGTFTTLCVKLEDGLVTILIAL